MRILELRMIERCGIFQHRLDQSRVWNERWGLDNWLRRHPSQRCDYVTEMHARCAKVNVDAKQRYGTDDRGDSPHRDTSFHDRHFRTGAPQWSIAKFATVTLSLHCAAYVSELIREINGMNSEMTMKPIIRPRPTISNGSIKLTNVSVMTLTSSS